MADGESMAAPTAVGFAAATKREERILIINHGNEGSYVNERIYGQEEVGTLQNLFQGNGRIKCGQLLFCIILLTLGILSAAMGVLAEFYSSEEKEAQKTPGQSCFYPADALTSYSTNAVIFLIAGQVLAIVFACSVYYSDRKGRPNVERRVGDSPTAYSSESLATTYLLASWVFCLIALYYFEAANMTRGSNKLGITCTVVKPLVFIKGSLFALAATASSLIFYLAKCAAANFSAYSKLDLSENQSLV